MVRWEGGKRDGGWRVWRCWVCICCFDTSFSLSRFFENSNAGSIHESPVPLVPRAAGSTRAPSKLASKVRKWCVTRGLTTSHPTGAKGFCDFPGVNPATGCEKPRRCPGVPG